MTRRTWKKAAALLVTLTMTFAGPGTVFAGQWMQNDVGWWYQNDDGSYPVNTWYQDTDGSWYFLNEQGYMISNCYRQVDGNFYAFGRDGRWTGAMFSDIAPGVWNGGNYSNDWSGFHLNVPAGYQVITAAQSGVIDLSQTMVEFVGYTPDGTGSGVELDNADAYRFPEGADTSPEYVVSVQSMLLAMEGYTIEGVERVKIGGKEYIKLSADGAGLVKRDFYCRKAGTHYFECLTAMYWLASQDAVTSLLGNVY